MANDGERLTVQQTMDLLGLSKARVHQLIAAGRLPVTRVGRAFTLRRADVLKFKSRDRPAGTPGRRARATE